MACTRTYTSLGTVVLGDPCPDCRHGVMAHDDVSGCAMCIMFDLRDRIEPEVDRLRRQVDAVALLIAETTLQGREAIPVALLQDRMAKA